MSSTDRTTDRTTEIINYYSSDKIPELLKEYSNRVYYIKISNNDLDKWEDLTGDQQTFINLYLNHYSIGIEKHWMELHDDWQNIFSKYICTKSKTSHTCYFLTGLDKTSITPLGYYHILSEFSKNQGNPPRIIKVEGYYYPSQIPRDIQTKFGLEQSKSGGNFYKKKVIKDNKPEKKVIKDNKPEKKVIKDNKPEKKVIKDTKPEKKVIKDNKPKKPIKYNKI